MSDELAWKCQGAKKQNIKACAKGDNNRGKKKIIREENHEKQKREVLVYIWKECRKERDIITVYSEVERRRERTDKQEMKVPVYLGRECRKERDIIQR